MNLETEEPHTPKKRFTDEQIAFALRQAESGTTIGEISRKIGIAEATFNRWKKAYAGMGVAEIRRLKQLEREAYVDEVVVEAGAEEIARHRRSYATEDFVFDPLHCLDLIERKVGALDQAAPLQSWDLGEEFTRQRRLMEAQLSRKNRRAAGKREFVQVLQLFKVFPDGVVRAAVHDALELGAISADAVKHLALCKMERRPPRLDLSAHPHLPASNVAATDPADYMALMTGAAPRLRRQTTARRSCFATI